MKNNKYSLTQWNVLEKNTFSNIVDGSIQCIVTSPPYFWHRKYTDKDLEIGKESCIDIYINNLVKAFSLIKNKLKEDGTLWLNLWDTYRENSLLWIPRKVAFALQENGWILRSDIIWEKPNAMPSSVKNRPTTSHEYIFLFSKNKDYYYDADSIREPHITFSSDSKMKWWRNHFGIKNGTPEKWKFWGQNNLHNWRWDQAFHPLWRNKRTVWNIPVSRFKGAHFAVFPEKLVENCIKAWSKEWDIILDPFNWSWTTWVVSLKNGRRYIWIDLNQDYIQITEDRLSQLSIF